MSKEAAMRAMREARYRERSEGSVTRSSPARRPVQVERPAPGGDAAPAESSESTESSGSSESLCGHRSMNGRSCTREHGHAAKSHRYA